MYDPTLGQFTPTGNLNQGRADAAAVRLANGQVLVVGGDSSGFFLTSAEIFDPASGTFTPTGGMNAMHQFVPAILLNNGKVLIAGCAPSPPTAELYDPVSGTFTPTAGAMIVNRCQYASAPLPDGRILFAGADASAEIYDPSTDSFSPTGSMNVARDAAAAAPLPDGTILISGGQSPIFNSAEIYDPVSGSFSFTSNMTRYRTQHTAIALSDGEILVALGFDQFGHSTSAELYHPSVEEFFSTGNLTQQRHFGTATLLANGQVLFVGGEDNSNTAIASAELYTPSLVWTPFSSFAANAQIHGGKKPSFNLYATAIPAKNGYAISPSVQNVYLALGTYSAAIPSSSFVYDSKHGLYRFSGVIQMFLSRF
jgi:Kelch motif